MTELPLSPHRVYGDLVHVSGTVGREPDGNIPESFERQATLAFEELVRQLDEASASMATVLKTTVFVVDRGDVPAMNDMYARHFTTPWPARSTIVTNLALSELKFEIEATAHLKAT